MGTSIDRVASLVGPRKRLGRRLAPAVAAFLAGIFITCTLASADSVVKRAVLGTIVASDAVQIAREPGAWTAGSNGTPVLENSELRTGAGKTTLVELGKHGVVGLREQSHVSVGKSGLDGLPLSLDGDGSLSFRLPLTSDLSILTDAAVIKGPGAGEAQSEYTSVQGIITQQGNLTNVSVTRGRLRVRNRGAEQFVWVGEGEQATITAAEETPRIARMTDASNKEVRRRVGAFGWFGTKTGLAVVGAAVGGGVGAAAAAGAFSGDDGSAPANVPAQGSPFSP